MLAVIITKNDFKYKNCTLHRYREFLEIRTNLQVVNSDNHTYLFSSTTPLLIVEYNDDGLCLRVGDYLIDLKDFMHLRCLRLSTNKYEQHLLSSIMRQGTSVNLLLIGRLIAFQPGFLVSNTIEYDKPGLPSGMLSYQHRTLVDIFRKASSLKTKLDKVKDVFRMIINLLNHRSVFHDQFCPEVKHNIKRDHHFEFHVNTDFKKVNIFNLAAFFSDFFASNRLLNLRSFKRALKKEFPSMPIWFRRILLNSLSELKERGVINNSFLDD